MPTALLILLVLVLVTAGVGWVNARHEAKRAARPPSADERVAAAWEDFGADDNESAAATAFEALLAVAPVEALTGKRAVTQTAVMALRAGRHDLLPALALRAESLGSGCGEARALAVLAATWAGDIDRARRMYAASQQAMAGCASCGAEASVRILLQEAHLALDAADHGDAVTDDARAATG